MNRRIAILAVAVAVLLTACQSGVAKMDLTGFRDENGEYVHPNAAWGGTAKEIEKDLGFSLGKPTTSSEKSDKYTFVDAVSWNGCLGFVQFDFEYDAFIGVTYMFAGKDDDLDRVYDSFFEMLTAMYGEPDDSIEVPLVTEIDGYKVAREGTIRNQCRWRKESAEQVTAMFLFKTYDDTAVKSVGFSVSRLIPDTSE